MITILRYSLVFIVFYFSGQPTFAGNANHDACENLDTVPSGLLSAQARLAAYYSCGENLYTDYVLSEVKRFRSAASDVNLKRILNDYKRDFGNSVSCASCHSSGANQASVDSLLAYLVSPESENRGSLIKLINPHISISDFDERIASGEAVGKAAPLASPLMTQKLLHHSTHSFEQIRLVFANLNPDADGINRKYSQSLLAYMQVYSSSLAQGQENSSSCETCHRPNTITPNLLLSVALQENILRSNCSRCHREENDKGEIGDATTTMEW